MCPSQDSAVTNPEAEDTPTRHLGHFGHTLLRPDSILQSRPFHRVLSPLHIVPSWCAAPRSAQCGLSSSPLPPWPVHLRDYATWVSRNTHLFPQPAHQPPPAYANGREPR